MQKILLLFLLILLLAGMSGCASIVMPYAENPLCSKGQAGGYCGTITDVNEVTDREMSMNKKNKNSKRKEVLE